jgi:hypothetical protein
MSVNSMQDKDILPMDENGDYTPTVQFIFDEYALIVFDEHESVEPGEYSGSDLADVGSALGFLQLKFAEDWRFKDMFHSDAVLLAIIVE